MAIPFIESKLNFRKHFLDIEKQGCHGFLEVPQKC